MGPNKGRKEGNLYHKLSKFYMFEEFSAEASGSTSSADNASCRN